MPLAPSPPIPDPSKHRVRAALDDPAVQEHLCVQAMALVRQRCSWRDRMAREQLSQEIVQETFLRAWAKRDEYHVDVSL